MRTDLNMRKGKMIAQGSHASMKVFFDRMWQPNFKFLDNCSTCLYHFDCSMQEWFKRTIEEDPNGYSNSKFRLTVGSVNVRCPKSFKTTVLCVPVVLSNNAISF